MWPFCRRRGPPLRSTACWVDWLSVPFGTRVNPTTTVAFPRRTEGQQLDAKHMHAQDKYGPRIAAAQSWMEAGRRCHSPRSLLSSSGTISGERYAWSHHIPGPRQPAGLFFPRWLERRAQSKEKMLMFRSLKYI